MKASKASKFLRLSECTYGSILSVSERLIGVTEVAFVELSGGLEKLSPLIFQSDYGKIS
jgi:hypothetical protein